MFIAGYFFNSRNSCGISLKQQSPGAVTGLSEFSPSSRKYVNSTARALAVLPELRSAILCSIAEDEISGNTEPMEKTPDKTLSGALKSDPKQNAKDADRLFGSESGKEAEEANKAMREKREAGGKDGPLTGSPAAERFGSPD
jgi:hypothetical protein